MPPVRVTPLERQGDDVSELESTAGGSLPENNNGDGQGGRQGKDVDLVLLSPCGSFTTFDSGTAAGSHTSLGSTVREANGGRHADRERKQRERHRRRKRGVGPIENMHFEGHLLHRVCGVAGKRPACSSSSRSYGGSDDDGGGQTRSECSLLEDSGEDQLVRLRRNPVVMDILVRLKALSLSLVDPGGRGADPGSSSGQAGGGGGGGGGGGAARGGVEVARVARQGYLLLFEEMLGELLKNQREKSKVRAGDGTR